MAKTNDTTQPDATDAAAEGAGHPAGEQLDQGTYDIIRNRLRDQGKTLRAQLDQLNEERKEVFGSIEFNLTGTDRITTDHNCIPRDMAAVGDRILVGYNVQFGLKTEIDLGDVFAVYRFVQGKFEQQSLDLIDDAEFRKDFQDLYRFYKKTVFAKIFRSGPYLYMKFRVGQDANDFKAFKWAFATDDQGNTTLQYIDNRSDHEVKYPTQHDFTWTRAGRDEQRAGKHPHVSIKDKVFIETIGGDLTIKVEDNTQTGQGIYSEPVDDPDQTLDDAEYEYVIEGHLILLRIRPYQEHTYRYFIFNTKLQEVHRCDTIGHACVLLPDDHGLMFCDGYYLASGELQTFPAVPADMVFERRIPAPNGEDYLYVFLQPRVRRVRAHGLQPHRADHRNANRLQRLRIFRGRHDGVLQGRRRATKTPRRAGLADANRRAQLRAADSKRQLPLQDRQPRHRPRHGRVRRGTRAHRAR